MKFVSMVQLLRKIIWKEIKNNNASLQIKITKQKGMNKKNVSKSLKIACLMVSMERGIIKMHYVWHYVVLMMGKMLYRGIFKSWNASFGTTIF